LSRKQHLRSIQTRGAARARSRFYSPLTQPLTCYQVEHAPGCRIAFHGRVHRIIQDPLQRMQLKIHKTKMKQGIVKRVTDAYVPLSSSPLHSHRSCVLICCGLQVHIVGSRVVFQDHRHLLVR
jgi:hypothetical protein